MGTGWRRARNALGLTVCTSIPRDHLDTLDSASPRTQAENISSPRVLADNGLSPRLQQLENTSPRLQCQTVSSPRLRCQTVVSPRVQSRPQSACSSPGMHSQSHSSPGSHGHGPMMQCRTNASPRLRSMENMSLAEGSVPSSPRSPSRLSLLRSSVRLSRSTCAMCLQTMKPGQGHAIFTAECSHAFHFQCIASSVKHGNLICPVCRAKWKEVPSQAAVCVVNKEEKAVLTPRGSRNTNYTPQRHEGEAEHEQRRSDIRNPEEHRGRSRQRPHSDALYDDDEPLDASGGGAFNTIHEDEEEEEEEFVEFQGFVVEPAAVQNGAAATRSVQVSLQPEVGALVAGKACENFTVLLTVKAPPASDRQQKSNSMLLDPNCRAPIDLVTVLDVSGSMSGTKLALLKRAMRLVISTLSPADRLSVVAFSALAKRIFPLRRMAPQGKKAARRVIDRLICTDGTNIADGLKKAAKVLEDRRQRNPVASIMLLSDGQDQQSMRTLQGRNMLPGSVGQSTRYGHIEIPVRAGGCDPAESAGAASFIQAVQDAFAHCIGGLLSVVVQDVTLTVSCASTPGVELRAIHAGTFHSRILDGGAQGTVKLGDLYAEEDRDILLELRIPAARFPAQMNLLAVRCSFRDPVWQQTVHAQEQNLSIPRPESLRGSPPAVCPKVESHKNRLRTARAISEARALADRGDVDGAHEILHSARAALQCCSAAARTCDEPMRTALEVEIAEVEARIRKRNRALLVAERSRERQRSYNSYRRIECDPPASMLDMVLRYQTDNNNNNADEPLTPTSAWRAAERLAKVAMMRKSLNNRVSDLHGFENARF